jgi:opacity protein-like surface antigen
MGKGTAGSHSSIHAVAKKTLWLGSLLLPMLMPASGKAQVAAAGVGGNQSLFVGGFGSYYAPDYGYYKLYGVGGFADYNLTPKLGAEAEARFLRFHQLSDIHEDTYLVGPRYSFYHHHKITAYGKGLIGIGEFNFPQNAAHGGYLAYALGGGVDYRLQHKWTVVGDYEYQIWPSFVGEGPRPNGLTPTGLSVGITYRIF